MGEIYIRLIDLPCDIKAFTALDNNYNYNIYINDKLSYACQKRALKHELRHIYDNHYALCTVDEIERSVFNAKP